MYLKINRTLELKIPNNLPSRLPERQRHLSVVAVLALPVHILQCTMYSIQSTVLYDEQMSNIGCAHTPLLRLTRVSFVKTINDITTRVTGTMHNNFDSFIIYGLNPL